MFLEILTMFFEFIRCQNIYRNFSEIFESIYNILSTKYEILGFFRILKIVKSEFSSHPNPRYIYMFGFISSSPFQNTKLFRQIQSLAPGIARRSSGRFQLRRQLRRAITPNPSIVCGIQGYRCVRLVEGFVAACSVRRLDTRISGNRRISSRLRRGSSSPVSSSILVLRFLQFLGFGEVAPRSPAPLPRRRDALPPTRARTTPAGAASGDGTTAWRGRPAGCRARLPVCQHEPLLAAASTCGRACPARRGRPPAAVELPLPCAAPMAMEFEREQ
jgi:hypothetical protein